MVVFLIRYSKDNLNIDQPSGFSIQIIRYKNSDICFTLKTDLIPPHFDFLARRGTSSAVYSASTYGAQHLQYVATSAG
jgi:hypothetical protein